MVSELFPFNLLVPFVDLCIALASWISGKVRTKEDLGMVKLSPFLRGSLINNIQGLVKGLLPWAFWIGRSVTFIVQVRKRKHFASHIHEYFDLFFLVRHEYFD